MPADDPARRPAMSRIVLCADDYAMTDGVSRSIEYLAHEGCLSATSAMVTTPHWPELGARARDLRAHVAVGLHINLTLGAPLGAMPSLAPSGKLPRVGEVTARALRGEIDREEIAAEVLRQLDRFETVCGHPPDFVDGHQHVHALQGLRDGVIDALSARRRDPLPLVRDPADRLSAILKRGTALPKTLSLHWLARGFGAAVRRAGFPVNDSFAGVSDFLPSSAVREFERAAIGASPLHLVMCHPGFVDDELGAIDPVTERRRVEHQLLLDRRPFADRLWRPQREANGPPVDWGRPGSGHA